MKKEAVHIRVSDILRGAPEEVLQALILVLIARALRRKPSQRALRIYNEYIPPAPGGGVSRQGPEKAAA